VAVFSYVQCCVLQIFETFGPVSCPLYSVRFNSVQHISEHGIEVGAAVFCVPNVSEWTHYIFLEHVRAYVWPFLTSLKQHVSTLCLDIVCLQLLTVFLLPDTVRWRGIWYGDVAVCPSCRPGSDFILQFDST